MVTLKNGDRVLIKDNLGNPVEGIVTTVDTSGDEVEYGVELPGSELMWIFSEDDIQLISTASVKDYNDCLSCPEKCSSLDLSRFGCIVKVREKYKQGLKKYIKD